MDSSNNTTPLITLLLKHNDVFKSMKVRLEGFFMSALWAFKTRARANLVGKDDLFATISGRDFAYPGIRMRAPITNLLELAVVGPNIVTTSRWSNLTKLFLKAAVVFLNL